MNNSSINNQKSNWFAIKTRQAFKAEEALKMLCDEVFFPKETISIPGRKSRTKALIPHVLFIKTSKEKALELEKKSRAMQDMAFSFWIYRYPTDNEIQVIPPHSIELLRLLTTDDTSECEIFNKKDFKGNEHVRVTGGVYCGLEGYVQRVKKNKHVIVKIEGVCMVMLPYIHPDLLEVID